MFIPLMLFHGTVGSVQAAKMDGALYPTRLLRQARENADKYPWAAEIRSRLVTAAEPWMKLSDDELWSLMFGNTIKRAWQVWSNGYCPACKQGVPMYSWIQDPFDHPWKVRCPHCKELFPKNDFYKFYLSGLDEHGIFDPKRADRSLLFNTDHPDPNDPLHKFGVDDGEGYVEGGKRWRFIGAYLIYGQWKKAVLAGITNLAAAYAITGDKRYSHKAGVLLDRVADLYPTFDFGKEGVMYEGAPLTGYVSTWHDACWEARELAIAYDRVFEGLQDDEELVAFLSDKAKRYGLDNPKSSMAHIRQNIEDRIFRDTLANPGKIHSNYPETDLTITIIKTVLDWPENREEVLRLLGGIVEKATAVDGLTGEKGLTGYSSMSPISLGATLGLYSRIDDSFLRDMLKQYPRIYDCYRFHIDTWCFGEYYPLSGDCGSFARKTAVYRGLAFTKSPGLNPSMFTFLWQLYEITKDPAFVQILYKANEGKLDGLPNDIFCENPAAFQEQVKAVLKQYGEEPNVGSVNKQEWHMAILRSGRRENGRALWLDYDSGGAHGHMDGLNLGLFAKGLDLMPDFGYPPVHYGGWDSAKSRWYTMTAAHNTVVVDDTEQQKVAGKTTLWAVGKEFQAIRVSAPAMYKQCKQYERTAALVNISDRDSYVIDIFRVVGGMDHAKIQHSHFGTITTSGLSLAESSSADIRGEMRAFRIDPSPNSGWIAEWKIDDRYGYTKARSDIRMRCTDFTSGAAVYIAEKWVSLGQFSSYDDAWIPCIITRRRLESYECGPLASTFVTVIEPYNKRNTIKAIRRLSLETPGGTRYSDSHVALEVAFNDGRSDLFVAADVENPLNIKPVYEPRSALVQKESGLQLVGEICCIRRDVNGNVSRIALCRGRSVKIGKTSLELKEFVDFIEISLEDGRVKVLAGPENMIQAIEANGVRITRYYH